MSKVTFDTANKDDIPELIRLRLAYIIDDYGSINESERKAMEEQLPDYFDKRLGKELIAFVARAEGRLIAAAYLLIIEKPANPSMPNGLVGEVFSVFTEKEYRGKGISTRLMTDMIEYAAEKHLCHIDLKATDEGYPIYKRLGFDDKNRKYKDMRLKLSGFETAEKIIAACGNDCAACPRYTAHSYEKTDEELHNTAELWMKIGYRDHLVSNEEIACSGCKPENWCRYRVIKCCVDRGIKTCGECSEYPCDNIKECFAVTESFEPMCRQVCTDDEYKRLKKAFFEKEKNLATRMVKLDPARKEDVETLWKMQVEAFADLLDKYKDFDLSPGSESIDKVMARFEQPWTTYYFIIAGGIKVGAIRIVDKQDGSRKRISPIWIMPEYRNKGYAQQAILEAEKIYGSDHWCLDTILQEKGNLHLYEKIGYHRTGRIDKINDKMDIVFYEKDKE